MIRWKGMIDMNSNKMIHYTNQFPEAMDRRIGFGGGFIPGLGIGLGLGLLAPNVYPRPYYRPPYYRPYPCGGYGCYPYGPNPYY